MTITARLPLAACAAVLLSLPGVASAASGCSPKGAKIIAANGVAKVYTLSGGDRLYGCLRRVGKPKLLVDRIGDGYYTSYDYAHVALAGTIVGYSETETDVSCKTECPPDYEPTMEYVVSDNLKTRKTRSLKATATTIAVNAAGGLAWTEEAAAAIDLHYSPSGAVNTRVDSGAIDRVSFCGEQLLWRNGGQGRWIDG